MHTGIIPRISNPVAPRLSAGAPPPAAAPRDAAAPAGPRDAAQISSPVPTSNPWPDLERAGVVGVGSATSGPIGQTLGQLGRQGLLDGLVRLQSKGISFERERSWFRVPFTAKHVPMTPEQTLQRLETKGVKRLQAVHGDGQRSAIASVNDLRDLDAVYGLGPEAATADERGALTALHDFRAAGWTTNIDRYDSSDKSPLAAWQSVRSDRRQARLVRPDGTSVTVGTKDDLVNAAWLELGVDRGVKRRDVLDGVRAMTKLGLEFPSEYYRDPVLTACSTLADGGEVRANLAGSRMSLSVKAADLKAPDAVKARLDASQGLWDRCFAPVIGRYESYYSSLLDFAQGTDAKFGSEMRAAVASAVLRQVGRNDARDGAVEKVTRRLENLAADDLQLAWLTNRFATTARHEGFQGGLNLLSGLEEGVVARTATRAEADRLRPVLYDFVGATGSIDAALEGIDLVRIAVGSEPEAQRVRLFLDIAAHESEKTLDRTASDYRAVLVNRRPGEDLAAAGKTFLDVLQMLSLGRQQERAAEVFATVQEGLKQSAYGAKTSEEVLSELGQSLTLGSSVDDALDALRGRGRGAGVPAGPASVEHDGNTVVIGGIRVPRSQPGAAQ